MKKLFLIACLGVSLAGCGSCKDEPQPEKVEAPAQTDAGVDIAPEVHPFMTMRQAFGLPFPPDVQYVRKGPRFVEVGTNLSLEELERFFKGRLVDYEYLHPHQTQLRIIGLRAHMPQIRITNRSSRQPIAVRYIEQFAAVAAEAKTQAEPAEPAEEPEKGDPVQIKMPDGKLLAPGARWGEPYTPPPTSPLYQERYRANFGKPFGEWQLN